MIGLKPRSRTAGRGSTLFLALVVLDLAGLASPKRVRGTPAVVPECEGFRIAVLDLNDLSEAASVNRCSLSDVHVDVGNGVVYSSSLEIENSVAHSLGTHSAPYFLRGAIQASKYYTTNLDEADLILVYDYCHYIVWLGHVHAYGSSERWLATPGDSLTATYKEMMKLPAWKKHDGAQFVFYDAHPGFFNGKASIDVGEMRCEAFKKGIHIIVDTPMRNVCERFWEMKDRILVTPYVPNPLDRENPRAYLQQEFRGLKDRPVLAYCRSTCNPYMPPSVNAGKLMRYWFSVKVWGSNPEMDVRCTDGELSNEGHLPFTEMFGKMRSATFCPAFPGDAASTRRLSEMFLAGCIPVFLGPPYHSMPFSETVPYKQLGVFFNISDTSNWMKWEETMKPMKMEWQYHPTIRASHETEARWWIPDTPIDDVTIHVDNADQVLDKLKAIPPEVLEAKLRLMHDYGTRFAFLKRLTTPPNAVNSLMAGMCKKQTNHPSRQTLPANAAAQTGTVL